MTTQIRTLHFSDVSRGDLRWSQHFRGRPGCARTLIGPGGSESGHAAGVHIEMPEALGVAWDSALRFVKGNRSLTVDAARAHIEAVLDAVAPREVRS